MKYKESGKSERERERIKIIHKYAYRGKYLQDVVRWENMLFKDRLCCCFWPLPYCFWWMMHFVIGTLKMRTSTNKTHYTFGNKLSHAKDNYVLDGDVIWKLPGFLVNWGSSLLLEIFIWPFFDLWDIFMRAKYYLYIAIRLFYIFINMFEYIIYLCTCLSRWNKINRLISNAIVNFPVHLKLNETDA